MREREKELYWEWHWYNLIPFFHHFSV